MNLDSIQNNDSSLSLHMNQIFFSIQEHQDLQQLKYKKGETININSNDDLKTEEQQQKFTDQCSKISQSNEQGSLEELEIVIDDKFLKLEDSISQNNKVNSSKILDTPRKKFSQTSYSKNKAKISLYSKDSFQNIGNEGKRFTSSNICQAQISSQGKEKQPKILMKVINLLVNVKSFYNLLTKNSRILGKLTREQHNLINDQTSIYNGHKEQRPYELNKFMSIFLKILQIFQKVFSSLVDCIPMFQPYNYSKFLWDVFQALLILAVMFIFSLITFFQMESDLFGLFFQIAFIMFLLDMIFTFNTGILEKGNVIFDRKKAAIVYLKRNFVMDQIALVPLFMFFFEIKLNGLYSWAIYFQILMKLFVLQDIFNRLTYYLNYQKNMKNIVDLVKLVFIIGCVCHIFCLFWHGLAIFEANRGRTDTWLHVKGLINQDVFTRYIYSFYYLAVTMITVGYGDILPSTPYEILFTTITMFVTGFFYAFSLNRIGNIIDSIEMKDKSYKENMQVIHRFMREEKVNQGLRVQISNYLEYLYKESNEVVKNQEKDIIDKLSKQLKYELIQDIQGKYLKDIPFIQKLKSQYKIVEIMEEYLFSPGEYIFRQGQLDDCSIYYIVKGQVQISYEYEQRNETQSLIIETLKKSQFFGNIELISGSVRTLTAQASDFCRIYKIPRNSLLEILKESDQDYENFQMIKEASTFKESYQLLNLKCQTCKKFDHISIKCPKTHLTVSKQTLIHRGNTSIPHLSRKYFQRKNQMRFGTLINNFVVIDAVYQFQEKDENILVLQQFEDDLHLSQDEAFIEECCQELQDLEFQELKPEEIKNDQYRLEINKQQINEVVQEEEDDKEESKIESTNSEQKYKLPQINNQGISNQFLLNNDTDSLRDLNILTTKSLLQHNNIVMQRNPSFKQNKRLSSSDTKQTESNNYRLTTNQSESSNIQQQSLHKTISNNYSSSYRSSSNYSEAHTPPIQQNDEVINDLQIPVQLNSNKTPNINQNLQPSKINSIQSSDLDLEQKKQKSQTIQQLESKQSPLCNGQKQKESSASILGLPSPVTSIIGNSFAVQPENQISQDQSQYQRIRKTQSLNFQKGYTEQKNFKQHEQKQNQSNQNIGQLKQIFKKQYFLTRNAENINNNNQKQQLRRSQSLDQSTISQIIKQWENQNNQIHKISQNKIYSEANNLEQIKENNHFYNNKLQKEESCMIKQFQKQTSISSSNSQNKFKSNFSNSQIQSLLSLGNKDNNQKQISNQQIQDKSVQRRQSKKYTFSKSIKYQPRLSQILLPGMIQQQNLNYLLQNPIMKNQLSYLPQFSQTNCQTQAQQNQENLTGIFNQQQQIKNQQNMFNLIPNINQGYQHQSSLTRLPQIAQLLSFSPNIRQRRSNNIVNNNFLQAQVQEAVVKNMLSNSIQLGGYEQRNSTTDQIKRGSQMDAFNKDYSKKNNFTIKSDHQIPSNLNMNNQISHLVMQENNMYGVQIDSNYLMLQIFDKFRIYKFYYPSFNMNVVISNLKQNDSILLSKHKQIRQKATSRNTVYSKKQQRQPQTQSSRIEKIKLKESEQKNNSFEV